MKYERGGVRTVKHEKLPISSFDELAQKNVFFEMLDEPAKRFNRDEAVDNIRTREKTECQL